MAMLFAAVVWDIAWLEDAFKTILTNGDGRPNAFGIVYMGGGLLFLPVGLVMALLPMLRRGADGKRHLYVLNVIVVVCILAIMTETWGQIIKDVYRCDIQKIPNCD